MILAFYFKVKSVQFYNKTVYCYIIKIIRTTEKLEPLDNYKIQVVIVAMYLLLHLTFFGEF